jgi:amino acid adenylation domain-containing protein
VTGTTGPGTLTELFDRSVRLFPEHPAVGDDRGTLTYAELDRRSDAVSALLRGHGVREGARVGLYVRRSAEVFVALLGILKAGAAYVAVDTRYPDARRDLMLDRSGAEVVLTEPGWEGELSSSNARAVALGGHDGPGDDGGEGARGIVAPESAASVLFTSGSTGEPKAIVLEHRNLVSFAVNTGMPALFPQDRVGQVSSLSFDAFHFEMWSTLAAGAQTVVLPPVPDLLAEGFGNRIREYGVTAMLVPTMVVDQVVREDRDAFASLRVLGTGGDVLPPAACRAVLGGWFTGDLYNLYGPAEITTACTAHLVTRQDAESAAVPIGRPLAGVGVRLLDQSLRPVAPGETGEVFVSGPGVARGYQGRDDLTAERFVAVPAGDGTATRAYRTGDLAREREDGALVFVGRADDQVKIRGYRVEPGEVGSVLLRHSGVREAVVLPEGEGGDRRLVAFVVPDGPLDTGELRARAERELPGFMVPGRFVVREGIPVTAHGKRDLGALREALAGHGDPAGPGTEPLGETERYLAGLWAELLGAERVGRDEDFFGLGGHSLQAFRMHHRINRELGTRLAFPDVLDNPVLKDLASAVDAARPGA